MQRKKFHDVFKTLAELFKILAHPDRLRILAFILESEKDVAFLTDALEISQSSLSQHLKLLRLNHLVSERREGKKVFYKLESQLMGKLILDAIEIQAEELSKETKSANLYKEIQSILKSKQ